MHPRTEELLAHLEAQRAVLRRAFDDVPEESRGRKPAPERWSVVEVLEHLGVVEAGVAALLDRSLRQALAAPGGLPPDPSSAPVLPTIDEAALLDRERRFQSPANVQPKGSGSAAEAWQALARSRERLRSVVLAGDGLATGGIQAPHPFLGTLDFHQWIAFVGFHEARHAAQIRATAAELERTR